MNTRETPFTAEGFDGLYRQLAAGQEKRTLVGTIVSAISGNPVPAAVRVGVIGMPPERAITAVEFPVSEDLTRMETADLPTASAWRARLFMDIDPVLEACRVQACTDGAQLTVAEVAPFLDLLDEHHFTGVAATTGVRNAAYKRIASIALHLDGQQV